MRIDLLDVLVRAMGEHGARGFTVRARSCQRHVGPNGYVGRVVFLSPSPQRGDRGQIRRFSRPVMSWSP